MAIRRIGIASIGLGAVAAATSVFLTWGRVQAGGHIFVFYRRIRGWDLQEGVVVWTFAVVAAVVAYSGCVALPARWRRAYPFAGLAVALGITVATLWFQLDARDRVWDDARNTVLEHVPEASPPPGVTVVVRMDIYRPSWVRDSSAWDRLPRYGLVEPRLRSNSGGMLP